MVTMSRIKRLYFTAVNIHVGARSREVGPLSRGTQQQLGLFPARVPYTAGRPRADVLYRHRAELSSISVRAGGSDYRQMAARISAQTPRDPEYRL